jgi:hypothetical protein
MGQAPMSQACNPSYKGDRDQEDHSSKPAWEKSLQDPISTNSRVQWCPPVIPATAERIKRIAILSKIRAKMGGFLSQGVECLHSKNETLSSNGTTKKK